MIAFVILLIVCLFLLYMTNEPPVFRRVKEKYEILREHVKDTKFHILSNPIPITGLHRMKGHVGYNTNKGAEIVLCLDGEENEIFHVLIHELAHCTVDEYSHSDEYWKNYTELRDMCVDIGIYEKIPEKTKFCGQHVQDK